MKNRIISLLLVVTMLFAFSSCRKAEDEIPPKDKDLTVEIEAVEYTDEEINGLSGEFADVAAEVAPLLDLPTVNDNRKADLAAKFKSDIIPLICEVPVYSNELSELLACVRAVAAAFGEEDKGGKLEFFSSLYIEFSSVLDTYRLGALLYKLQIYSMDNSLEKAEKNYDKYGHGYYLDDIEHYTALLAEARELGVKAYSDAISVFVFMASASLGSISSKGGAVNVSVGDLFVIMKKQGEKFASLELSGEDWQTVARMCEELIPDSTTSVLGGKLLWVLDDEDFFAESAAIMPELIDFYALITSDLSKEHIEVLESGEELAVARVVCGELSGELESLGELLVKLEEFVPDVSDEMLRIINTYDKDGYSAFLEGYGASREELISAIENFVQEPTQENYSSLERTAIGYAANVNSALAYVYLYL